MSRRRQREATPSPGSRSPVTDRRGGGGVWGGGVDINTWLSCSIYRRPGPGSHLVATSCSSRSNLCGKSQQRRTWAVFDVPSYAISPEIALESIPHRRSRSRLLDITGLHKVSCFRWRSIAGEERARWENKRSRWSSIRRIPQLKTPRWSRSKIPRWSRSKIPPKTRSKTPRWSRSKIHRRRIQMKRKTNGEVKRQTGSIS